MRKGETLLFVSKRKLHSRTFLYFALSLFVIYSLFPVSVSGTYLSSVRVWASTYSLSLRLYQNDLSTLLTSNTFVTMNNGSDYRKAVTQDGWVNFTGISSSTVTVKAQWENSTDTNGWVQVNGSASQTITMGDDRTVVLRLSIYKNYTLKFEYSDGSKPFLPDLVKCMVHNGSVVTVPTQYDTFKLGGWWKLDEKGGPLLNDSSGNGNAGTLASGDACPISVSGRFGGGLKFDGADGFATIPDSEGVRASANMTIEAWIKPSYLPSKNHHIISKWGEYSFVMNGPYLQFGTFGGNIRSNTRFSVEKWYYIVAVWRQEDSYELYINGRLDNNASTTDTSQGSSEKLYFGASNSSREESYFDGVIDNVKIYHRAKTADEIFEEYSMNVEIGEFFELPKVANGRHTISQVQYWDSNIVLSPHPNFSPTKDFGLTRVRARIYNFTMTNMKDQNSNPFTHTFSVTLPNSTTINLTPDTKGNIGPIKVVNGSIILPSTVNISKTEWCELAPNQTKSILVSADTTVDNYLWIHHGDETPPEEEERKTPSEEELLRYAARLDGRDAHITLGDNSILKPSSVTVAAWIYEPHSWPNGGFSIGFFAGGFGTEETYGYILQVIDNLEVRWVVGNGTRGPVYNVKSGRAIQLETWELVVGMFESSSGTLALYHNGRLVRSIKGCSMTYGNSAGYIGLEFPPENVPNSALYLYNVQIYNRSLEAWEIERLYDVGPTGAPPIEDGLVGWWLTDSQKPSNLVKDNTRNQNDGIVHGNVQWDNSLLPAHTPITFLNILSEILSLIAQISSFSMLLLVNGLAWLFVGLSRHMKGRLLSTILFSVSCVIAFESPVAQSLTTAAISLSVAVIAFVTALLIAGPVKLERTRIRLGLKPQEWIFFTLIICVIFLISATWALIGGRIDIANELGRLTYYTLGATVVLALFSSHL